MLPTKRHSSLFGLRQWHWFPVLALLLAGCSTHHTFNDAVPPVREGRWLVLPLINHSQTPMAGEQAEAILETHLHALGVQDVVRYPRHLRTPVMVGNSNRQQADRRHQQWLQQQGGDYLVTGSVEEWRYKSGLDGEPAVGMSLKITSLSDNRIVWSGSASRSGWPRESLSGTAQKVIHQLTDDIDW